MKFSITKNPHKDAQTYVELTLRREDLSGLFQDGVLTTEVVDTESSEVRMTLTVRLDGEFGYTKRVSPR